MDSQKGDITQSIFVSWMTGKAITVYCKYVSRLGDLGQVHGIISSSDLILMSRYVSESVIN